jgi:type IV pilus assembly protein PilQ
MKIASLFCSILILTLVNFVSRAQTEDRFIRIENQLKELAAKSSPGLLEPIDFSVSGVSIQEFLRGIALAHELNINIDPTLNFKVYNNFSKENALNVILFLVREYDLDIQFIGSILSFSAYVPPPLEPQKYVAKEIQVKFTNYTNLLSLDLKNDSLHLVARKITQVTKKNIILSTGIGDKLINVYIEEMPFDAALNKMAYANNLKLVITPDNFYVLKSLTDTEEPLTDLLQNKSFKPSVPNSGLPSSNNGVPNAYSGVTSPTSIRCFVDDTASKRKIHVEAINAPIQDVIKTVAAHANINYFLYSDLKGNCTSYVNGVTFDELLTFLLQPTEYTYKTDQGLYLIGERKIEGLRAHKVIQLKYRSLDNIQEVIPADLRKGVEIKEFKELNSILITGSLPQINEIEAFIVSVDKVVPMVMIEVIIMDIKKSRTVKTGISAGLKDSVQTSGTFLPGLDLTLSSSTINDFIGSLGVGNAVNLGSVNPNFYMTLSALETNSNVEVKSMPKLSTLNGHDANMSIGQTVYYQLETQNTLGSLTTNTIRTVQYQSVQANQTLTIKPLVSGDEQVTLTIEVSISDFLPSQRNGGPPNSATSQFKSMIRVLNGEMVVLGGLERVSKSQESSGVPVLSRIPGLKWLFSSRTKTKSKSITVLFIKPTIIY